MKVVFCASEAVPFAKTGGLADVCGALPAALAALGAEVILVMPRYHLVVSSGVMAKSFNRDFDVATVGGAVRVYLLKDPTYMRSGLYGDRFGDYPDNLRRFSKLCLKTLELLGEIRMTPDVIHCHDWQTSLLPIYLKDPRTKKPGAWKKKPHSLLTIHNMVYQGVFAKEHFPQSGLGWDYFNMSGVEFYGKMNLLKGGIVFADHINTVSPTYATEVQTVEAGCGLEGVLAHRKDHFCGILNGIDYRIWNPQSDAYIAKNYSSQDLFFKKDNKRVLQEACGLSVAERTPMLGFVGRLVGQKGVDLILQALPKICAQGVQVVVLGQGDHRLEDAMTEMAGRFPGCVFYSSAFDDHLAHQIYAGSDIFLMPSRFEPCGIGQMIGFKYATIPVVFRAGGLADTVTDWDEDPVNGNGFVFRRYVVNDLLDALERALRLYANAPKWTDLMRSVMKLNFSWKESARRYLELYDDMCAK